MKRAILIEPCLMQQRAKEGRQSRHSLVLVTEGFNNDHCKNKLYPRYPTLFDGHGSICVCLICCHGLAWSYSLGLVYNSETSQRH